jgi:hypothetical protein
MKPKSPKRLEDVKITPEAAQLFERAVDRALDPARRVPAAKKAAPVRAARSRKAKGTLAATATDDDGRAP